jgi:uncharacterized protein YjbI with pentapeptide repeats
MTDFLCHVKEGLDDEKRQDWRAACEDLDFYREHESKRYCVLHYPGKEKEADEHFHSEVRKRLNGNVIYLPGVFFPGNLEVRNRQFTLPVDFSGATFAEKAQFYKVRFQHNASFTDTTFHGGASFEVTNFEKVADFSEASFIKGPVNFSQTTFKLSANFSGISFGDTDFDRVTFEKQGNFNNSTFRGEVTFRGGCAFKEARFGKTVFEGKAYFTDTSFAKVTFFGATFGDTVSFLESTFGTAKFSYVTFRNFALFKWATFEEKVDFTNAHFETALFEEATFHRSVDFTCATFSPLPTLRTDFRRATFEGELYFREAEFNGNTDFYRANFLDAAKFIGGKGARREEPTDVFASEGQVSFTRARVDKPELFSFDTLRLRPSWLVRIDARNFNFTGVEWYGVSDGEKGSLDDEIIRVRHKGEAGSPYALLAQACQRLAANAEDNRDYPRANEFHYWSMDALRKERWSHLHWIRKNWRRVEKRFGLVATARWALRVFRKRRLSRPTSSFGPVATIYWALSGYGERAGRALGVLATIALVFAVLYMMVGHPSLRVLPIAGIWQVVADAGRAVMYSLGVMARLRPEPIPEHMGVFQILVTIEGILGPLQIALLALAVRRKVMR